MEKSSKSKHVLELASELLDDIELNRISAESLLLKCTRLARYAGSEEISKWLEYELIGYNSSDPISLKYMGKTGRWTNRKEMKGYWGPLSSQEAAVNANTLRVQSMSIPNTSGDSAPVATRIATDSIRYATQEIITHTAIRSRVLGLLHQFVSNVYYEKTFDNLAESIFDSYKKDTDLLIGEHSQSVMQQIPSVMDRLSDGDQEAVSQALVTCRRIVDSFANSVMPPSDEVYEIDGNQLSLKADKTLNRINVYVHQNCGSSSRKRKFRQNLSNLYDRVSTGVHNDVSIEEAKALFLNTYLILGEILNLTTDDR
ncbi:hypothetical protein V1498_06765 [Peribacillus sp. SCS-26]|uniref:AbiTii domain-containing protein n=1 Tax=Paraperibacillus marinus TaxID=3115295 RepID=UPI00390638E6